MRGPAKKHSHKPGIGNKNSVQIKDIIDNQSFEGIFLVKEMNRSETRAGKPFLILTIMDNSGELGGRLWESTESQEEICRPGSIVRMSGTAQPYKGVRQLKIDSVSRPDHEVDRSLFLPSAPISTGVMLEELQKLIKKVREPFLYKLLDFFFNDPAFIERFKKAPAAKNMHHAYYSGLLEHTLAVARLAESISPRYDSVDESLLMAGAILHDIGKTVELDFESYPFDYTNRGRLVGHLVLGAEMVQSATEQLPGFPEELSIMVQHLILSHHGKYEFGSPALPMILEAFILNLIDDLDAKANYLERLSGECETEDQYQWSAFQRTLERFLYIKGRAHQDKQENSAGNKPATGNIADERQNRLF